MQTPMVFKNVPRLSLALISLALLSLTMAGCSSTKDSVLPQEGPTMKELYEGHMAEFNAFTREAGRGQRLPPAGIDHYVGFVREAANEIDTIFGRLPNPTLVMYIYPHLSGEERTPVPGYVTSFPFYEKVEYALPGGGARAFDEWPGGRCVEGCDEYREGSSTGGIHRNPLANE